MRKVAKREQVQGNVFFCCQMVCRECVCFCTYLLGRLMYSCVCLCEGFTKVRFFPRDLGEKGRKREREREESVWEKKNESITREKEKERERKKENVKERERERERGEGLPCFPIIILVRRPKCKKIRIQGKWRKTHFTFYMWPLLATQKSFFQIDYFENVQCKLFAAWAMVVGGGGQVLTIQVQILLMFIIFLKKCWWKERKKQTRPVLAGATARDDWSKNILRH